MKRRIRTATGKCDFTREYTYDEEGNIATLKQGDETETYTYAQGGKACDVVGQCFIVGTLVLCMDEDGNQCHKPIEDIKVGDMVWAYDEETGENDWKPVVRLFRNETEEWYHIFVNGEEIVCTGGHPFYVVGEGFVEAKDLKISDKLLLSNGTCAIIEQIEVEQLATSETTYNFEVADFHTYYVSANKIGGFMKLINVVYDYEYDDSTQQLIIFDDVDIVSIPDYVCENLEEIVQKFFDWTNCIESGCWKNIKGRLLCCVETEDFIKWINNNYYTCENKEATIIKQHTKYNSSYPVVEF